MSLICKVIGHNWRYNFPNGSNKRICARCKIRQKLDLRMLEWKESNFPDPRTSEELIQKWFK